MKTNYYHTIIKVVILPLLVVIIFTNCSKDDSVTSPTSPKKSDFESPEEFISNPSVNDATENSDIDVNYGNNPPPLAGTYILDGQILEVSSSDLSSLIGLAIKSEMELFNQTTSGKISLRETVGNITVWGSGGYITGESDNFTIWQESKQSGAEAGLPNDITINVALLMSGRKFSNGNLDARGISIITKVETSNTSYNTELIEGLWWLWEADFDLQGLLNKTNNSECNYSFLKIIIEKLI
ncbi:MAG: hypothetical protein K9N07_09775 [Candidatus Cloacimonetes bacterium]|nr:hypothetical protein [Candidatus Cloacimonadota bacterium]